MTTFAEIIAIYDMCEESSQPLIAGYGSNRYVDSVNWVDDLAKPFAEWLRDEGGFKEVVTAGPFGIGARLSVTLLPRDGMKSRDVNPPHDGSVVMTLESSNDEHGRMRLAVVDYSRPIKNPYPPNSLGALNGLDHKAIDLDETMSADDILALAPTLYHLRAPASARTFASILSGYREAYAAHAPIAPEAGKTRSDENVNWMDDLITPFATWLKEEGGYDQAKVLGPYGPMAKISITLSGGGKKDAGVVVEPTGLVSTTMLVMVDYSATPVTYPPNSLGALSGPQYPTKDIAPDLMASDILKMAVSLGNKPVPETAVRKAARMMP